MVDSCVISPRSPKETAPLALKARRLMLNAHLPTENRRSSVGVYQTPTRSSALIGANRRYSADSKFESALEPVGASR